MSVAPVRRAAGAGQRPRRRAARRSRSRRSSRRATARRTSRGSPTAAPGARLVTMSREGLADGPVDDVEVLLRGFLAADAFERLLAHAPSLRWVHSATAGVERVLTPAARGGGSSSRTPAASSAGPIAEYVLLMILAVSRRLPQLLELQAERTWQPLESRSSATSPSGSSASGASAARSRSWRRRSGRA